MSLFKTGVVQQLLLIKGDGRARETVFRRFYVSLFQRGVVFLFRRGGLSLFKAGVIQQLLLTKGDGRARVTAVVDETARNTVHFVQN